jgi:hypothetical protein
MVCLESGLVRLARGAQVPYLNGLVLFRSLKDKNQKAGTCE